MTATIVVPGYNEGGRLDVDALADLATAVDHLILVDDGSTDDTRDLFDAVAARSDGRVTVVATGANRGKAEAVRAGMRCALDSGASVVGYFDADLATPVAELLRLIDVIGGRDEIDVVLASRVGLLGHTIERRATRHYLGRLYATAASLALGVAVYDTQCGAKLFRATDALRAALATPFPDRWSFDVELLARLLHPGDGVTALAAVRIVEVPLQEWRDVGGSKMRPLAAARAAVALAGVRRRTALRTRT